MALSISITSYLSRCCIARSINTSDVHGSRSVVQSLVILIRFGLVPSPVSVFSDILVFSTRRSCLGWFRPVACITVNGFLILLKASVGANNSSQESHFTGPAPTVSSTDPFTGQHVSEEVYGIPPLPQPYKRLPEARKVAEGLLEILSLCKQVVEAPVTGLATTRQDLGVRHGPKPHNKLPEAH